MASVREPVPVSDEQLMRYLDGELDPEEGGEVERVLAEVPEMRVKADALGQLREIVAARVNLAGDEADERLEAMWQTLRSEVRPTPSRAPPGVWNTVRERFAAVRSHLLTGALAAAAGALLATLIGGGQPAAPRPRPTATAADVESLEVPDGSAMVFQIPGEGGESSTTVIWLTAAEQVQGEGPI